MSRRRRERQVELRFRSTWGGRRKGAGRKKQKGSGLPRCARPDHNPRHPVHVSLKVAKRVWSLRSKRSFRVIEKAFQVGSDRLGMRLTHYSVQGNHIHLIVEADDRKALSRGMQGLTIRLARALNKLMGSRGKVFADRYFARALSTPRDVRNVIAYVLNNAKRHRLLYPGEKRDPFAGGRDLEGRLYPTLTGQDPPVASPITWLLRVGWCKDDPAAAPA